MEQTVVEVTMQTALRDKVVSWLNGKGFETTHEHISVAVAKNYKHYRHSLTVVQREGWVILSSMKQLYVDSYCFELMDYKIDGKQLNWFYENFAPMLNEVPIEIPVYLRLKHMLEQYEYTVDVFEKNTVVSARKRLNVNKSMTVHIHIRRDNVISVRITELNGFGTTVGCIDCYITQPGIDWGLEQLKPML